MQFPSRDLTLQYISLSYQDVVQRYAVENTASYFLDGLGNVIAYIPSSSVGNAILTNDQTASFSYTSSIALTSSIPFNGNRTIKRSPYTSLNVGGNTLQDFIENFFFPFIPATVAISSGGTTYYETGSVQSFVISSTVTANDETIFGTGSVYKDSIEWNTSSVIPPYTFAFTDVNINSNHSYYTKVGVDNNGNPVLITSNTKTAAFIYPYLWGMSTIAGLSGNSLYTEFTKQVQASGNKTISLIGNIVYIYFCYPSTYGNLTSILDPNNFESIGNFQFSSSVPVTSSGLANDWMTTYKVYRTTLVSDPNGSYQFKY